MTYDYSNLNVTPPFNRTVNNYYLSAELATFDYLLLNYTLPDKTNFKLKYLVKKIYFSRDIHNGKSHDIELVIQHESEDTSNPIQYVYQIFTFKNNNSKNDPLLLIDLKSDTKTKIDGNGILNINTKNNNKPVVYFIPDADSNLTEFLKPANTITKSIVFLWTNPITEYQIKNIEIINNCSTIGNEENAIIDWASIFSSNVNDSSDLKSKIVSSLITDKSKLTIPNTYSLTITYTQELSTDEIYIDCSPINESVENVNFYLEKLNGKNNINVKKMQEMMFNCIIMIIISGSVYFSTPAIFRNLLYVHKIIRDDIDAKINSGIAIGLGFDLVLITIVIMAIGISKKKQDLLFVSFILLIITLSFIYSVKNTDFINTLTYENISIRNIIIYIFFPLSYIPLYIMKYYMKSSAPSITSSIAPSITSSITP
jgi:hypothetical protein